MATSSTEPTADHIILNPDLRPASERNPASRYGSSNTRNNHTFELSYPRRRPKPRPQLPPPEAFILKRPSHLENPPANQSSTEERSTALEMSVEIAESNPFLLSSTKKPVFSLPTSSQSRSEQDPRPVFSLVNKPLGESSYIVTSRTLTASTLAPGPWKPSPQPELKYPRVFYRPDELPDGQIFPSSYSMLAETVHVSGTSPANPSMYASASASTATLTATPPKQAEPRPADIRETMPRQEKNQGKGKGIDVSRNSKHDDITTSTFHGFTPPTPWLSDTDSGWEVGGFQLAAHSDWSDGDFDEEGTGELVMPVAHAPEHVLPELEDLQLADPLARSVYYDAPEPDSEDEREEGEVERAVSGRDRDEDDGYAADSEAVPWRRRRFIPDLDDEVDASVVRLVPPLGVMRDRQRWPHAMDEVPEEDLEGSRILDF
ncbi:hypothetical protein NM688_g5323 [Phlebia brevispora]|uniref:Uncharacterized protein n=1 Tax=Phlebia brevispora TaxID=194682 RepID=A0ACC1SXI0_9APHY|nr:hypothetical protein NM688_g5323 [Phlebia brevispora]